MALITLNWPRLTWPRLAERHAAPWLRKIKPLGIHWLAMDHSRPPVRTDWGQKAITSWSLIPPGLSIDLWDRGEGT